MLVFRCAEKVSSSFAEAASSRKDGETTFDLKLGDLEQHLKTAEKQLLQSQVSRIEGREGHRCRGHVHVCRLRLSKYLHGAFPWRMHSLFSATSTTARRRGKVK